ncbi:MAG TPA: TIGR02452 family protein [Ruminococcaceae bacterium]|nr:TIGR02452 family protein [Oscillospiraceae bacterium]
MRTELITIFNDTDSLCRSNEKLTASIKETIAHQYVVTESDKVIKKPEDHRFDTPAEVIVSQRRSFEAAKRYSSERVCVLNFASSTHVGGGVTTGAGAQEECLCRCSTLYFAIGDNETKKNFHDTHYRQLKSGRMNSIYNDDCIYSPGITVFKSDTELPKLLPENEWYNVDVITCAAPNLNSRYEKIFISDKVLKELHKKRAKRILDIAVSEGEDVIILGAFGCGAFRNPPDIVAQAYREVIDDYKYDFKTIEFAVYCPPQQGSSNYHAFQRAFR